MNHPTEENRATESGRQHIHRLTGGARRLLTRGVLVRHGLALGALALIPAGLSAADPLPPFTGTETTPAATTAETTAKTAKTAESDVVALPKLKVEDRAEKAAGLTPEQARKNIENLAGGAAFIDSQSVERGRASSVADQLAFQPGVLAQAAGGNDSIKISIRGSAINRGNGFFRSGVFFQYDGLPITGAGGTPFELFEPLGLQYTELLKGANGFRDGPTALGGSINWVSETGYTASPGELHLEAGSFGYLKGQVASGGVEGPFDYYVSAIGSYRDGYQDYSNSSAGRLISNVGYKFLPNAETRFFYRFGYTHFQQPGTLTRAQIDNDPTVANTANIVTGAGRTQPGTHWIGNKTTFVLDDESELSIGGVYHNYPIEIWRNSSWDQEDVSAVINYRRRDKIFGLPSETTVNARTTQDVGGRWVRYNNTVGSPLRGNVISRHQSVGSSDTAVTVNNDLHVTKELTLTTGASVAYFVRDVETNFPVDQGWVHESVHFLPRAGFTYEVHPQLTFFGNVSQTAEPPNSWSSPQQTGIRKLYDQTATTYEVGFRPRIGIFEGSVSFFRSNVKNQLLSVRLDPVTTAESNASPTTLQGIEVGLDTTLWHADDKRNAAGKYDHSIVFRQALTINDFTYDNDATFGKNQLPGVPKTNWQGELIYNHPSGFYAGLTADYAASAYTDYANSFESREYIIFGAKAGYQSDHWDAFLDVRNLFNKKYASSISPTFNAAGADTAALYPGDGLGVFAGVTYRY